ncbi:MAG: carnitine dehydratase, partial [Chloroflexi bacterium]|nr:carnitine dehydratase [Chloroflexota bacterium]
MEKYQLYINGKFQDASSKRTFESLNPATEEPWALVAEAQTEDVNEAVNAAYNAFHGEWSSFLPNERGKFLRAIGDQLKNNAELLGTIETRDTGKMYKETKFQANYIAEFYYYYAGLVDKIEGSTLPIDKPDMQVFTTRVPIGVVAAIIPWNSQMFLTAVKLAPALAMGNTIVVKASEIAPAPLFEFAKLIDKVGLPKGVINIITGFADQCGKVLTSHPKIDRIAFTGGVHTARHIVRSSAENLSQVSLELGGKSPVAVFNDAKIDNALNGVTASIFGASGQS